jgi:hypothetical protein
LDLPIAFSGTYGELRGNHFHEGFDFKVGGKAGAPVHAIMDGYISCISVSQHGFGNAVYIKHYDGITSIYGHLDHFIPRIAKSVRKAQYAKENYRVLLYFGPKDFPVRKGDVIGYAGSTGDSGGPHLHLELHGRNGVPINYIKRGYYEIRDDIPPIFNKINFYSFADDDGIPETAYITGFTSPKRLDRTLYLPERFYVGIDAVDRQNGTSNRLAVEVYSVRLDTSLVFRFTVGEIPPSMGHSIKSLREFDANYYGGTDMIKSYVEPGDALASHIECSDSGIIVLRDTMTHRLEVTAEDQYGNSSSVVYKVKRRAMPAAVPGHEEASGRTSMMWNVPNVFMADGVTMSIPAGGLYRSIWFSAESGKDSFDPASNVWSKVWKLGDPMIPLGAPATLCIEADVPDSLHGRAIMVGFDKKGEPFPVGGHWSGDGVTAKVSSFGTYYVAIDTIAPEVSFGFSEGAKIASGHNLYVYASDNFSGLYDYRIEIDGKWALTTFSRKRIRVILDAGRYARNSRHRITVSAVDRAGNKVAVTGHFIW